MFRKGEKVRIVNNPYGSMLPLPANSIATITSDGEQVVGLKVGSKGFRCWMVFDNNGNVTIERTNER